MFTVHEPIAWWADSKKTENFVERVGEFLYIKSVEHFGGSLLGIYNDTFHATYLVRFFDFDFLMQLFGSFLFISIKNGTKNYEIIFLTVKRLERVTHFLISSMVAI